MEKEVELFTDPQNLIVSILLLAGGVLLVIASVGTFDLDKEQTITLSAVTTTALLILISVLLKPKKREREKEQRIIEKPIIKKEVVKEVQKPIIKKIIEKVEVPISKEKKEKSKPVKPRKRYDYVGSKLTETYHKSKCRLGKSIKSKYRVKENDKKYFKLRGYKACKVCKP